MHDQQQLMWLYLLMFSPLYPGPCINMNEMISGFCNLYEWWLLVFHSACIHRDLRNYVNKNISHDVLRSPFLFYLSRNTLVGLLINVSRVLIKQQLYWNKISFTVSQHPRKSIGTKAATHCMEICQISCYLTLFPLKILSLQLKVHKTGLVEGSWVGWECLVTQ